LTQKRLEQASFFNKAVIPMPKGNRWPMSFHPLARFVLGLKN
jgi:hypothetical protein